MQKLTHELSAWCGLSMARAGQEHALCLLPHNELPAPSVALLVVQNFHFLLSSSIFFSSLPLQLHRARSLHVNPKMQ